MIGRRCARTGEEAREAGVAVLVIAAEATAAWEAVARSVARAAVSSLVDVCGVGSGRGGGALTGWTRG